MCVLDAAAKEAEVARFLRAYPRVTEAGGTHPVLRGCDEIAWSEIPGCPAGVPAVLRGLLDPDAAAEAQRVLDNVLMDGVFRLSAVMPVALPFLLRLAADPGLPVRADLLGGLLLAAELCTPYDADEPVPRFSGGAADHAERLRCGAVFAAHAPEVAGLADGFPDAADRACLREVAGLR
ncbi:hypothetical protein NX794_07335 [Streptomyces sp. LP11]|uniref:Uncharacterized protein n=1 Tax=Streptomyces pyxinicus TaxID=2970331 RepID=A0ABT2AXR1_9ACTN|nr:hypothetical protein [Streptomyces sp. LP11]MCS0601042.1 hypothetical protein [Streptomyces sp. LP11]